VIHYGVAPELKTIGRRVRLLIFAQSHQMGIPHQIEGRTLGVPVNGHWLEDSIYPGYASQKWEASALLINQATVVRP